MNAVNETHKELRRLIYRYYELGYPCDAVEKVIADSEAKVAAAADLQTEKVVEECDNLRAEVERLKHELNCGVKNTQRSVLELFALRDAAIARAERAEAAITWVFANGHVVAQDFTSGNRDVYEIRTPEELEKAMPPDLNRIEAERLDKENKAVADWVAAINTQTTKETT